jgi:hypothetical protein
MNKQKIIAFDLDDVICNRPPQYENLGTSKYKYCQPDNNMIDIVNSLHDRGFRIKIYTARGMSTFNGDIKLVYKNLFELTVSQLKLWNVKYDELVMGKAHYDVLIDDKALNSTNINEHEILNFLKV